MAADFRADLDEGDPRERVLEELQAIERELGSDVAHLAAQRCIVLLEELGPEGLKRLALEQLGHIEGGAA
jgi:hypothetical protein